VKLSLDTPKCQAILTPSEIDTSALQGLTFKRKNSGHVSSRITPIDLTELSQSAPLSFREGL